MKEKKKAIVRCERERGFSLVEVLISLGIALVILAAAIGVFKSMTDSGVAATEVYERNTDIQAALNLIRRDLGRIDRSKDLKGNTSFKAVPGDWYTSAGHKTEEITGFKVLDYVTPGVVNGADAMIISYLKEDAGSTKDAHITWYLKESSEQSNGTTWLMRKEDDKPSAYVIPGVKGFELSYDILDDAGDDKGLVELLAINRTAPKRDGFLTTSPRHISYNDGDQIGKIRRVNVNIQSGSDEPVKTIEIAQTARMAIRHIPTTASPLDCEDGYELDENGECVPIAPVCSAGTTAFSTRAINVKYDLAKIGNVYVCNILFYATEACSNQKVILNIDDHKIDDSWEYDYSINPENTNVTSLEKNPDCNQFSVTFSAINTYIPLTISLKPTSYSDTNDPCKGIKNGLIKGLIIPTS